MPRIFVPAGELTGGAATLTGETHRYLTRVLRLPVGARIEVFDGQGEEIAATILRASARDVVVGLGERTRRATHATPPVTLLQGLPRAERMDLVVQKATELGAARVIPVRAARSAAGQQARPERWARIAREAARQCGRVDVPEVAAASPLPEAIAALGPETTTRLVPWEDAPGAEPLHRVVGALAAAATGVAVLVGPEGGLTPDEVALATAAGFRIVTLGPRILRTETAAIAALAVIQSLVGGLG